MSYKGKNVFNLVKVVVSVIDPSILKMINTVCTLYLIRKIGIRHGRNRNLLFFLFIVSRHPHHVITTQKLKGS